MPTCKHMKRQCVHPSPCPVMSLQTCLGYKKYTGPRRLMITVSHTSPLASWYQFYCLGNRDTGALVACPDLLVWMLLDSGIEPVTLRSTGRNLNHSTTGPLLIETQVWKWIFELLEFNFQLNVLQCQSLTVARLTQRHRQWTSNTTKRNWINTVTAKHNNLVNNNVTAFGVVLFIRQSPFW